MLAPFKTKSNSFDWRLGLKIGDLVDCEDHYGSWYGSTITEIMERQGGRKQATVSFKIYDEKGNKSDDKGKYFGLTGYSE